MKAFFLPLVTLLGAAACSNPATQSEDGNTPAAEPSLTLAWKSDSIFTGSESALYDEANDRIYVSSGNTDAAAKDNDGFISIVQTDGTVTELKWVSEGLHAPKGMTILNGKLYVSDIDELKVIDIASGSIEKTVAVN